jgi:hypothetical protein
VTIIIVRWLQLRENGLAKLKYIDYITLSMILTTILYSLLILK